MSPCGGLTQASPGPRGGGHSSPLFVISYVTEYYETHNLVPGRARNWGKRTLPGRTSCWVSRWAQAPPTGATCRPAWKVESRLDWPAHWVGSTVAGKKMKEAQWIWQEAAGPLWDSQASPGGRKPNLSPLPIQPPPSRPSSCVTPGPDQLWLQGGLGHSWSCHNIDPRGDNIQRVRSPSRTRRGVSPEKILGAPRGSS